MVNAEIKKTLDKYVQIIHELGNGNFGLRDGFLEPYFAINTSAFFSGDLIIRNYKLVDCWDCGRTAFRVGKELEEKGFEVKYKFARSQEGSIQNYVEVLDPDTKKIVRVDATPWYERLDPEYEEAGEHEAPTKDNYAIAILTQNAGPMLSVEKQTESLFIETYILGSYESTEDKLEEIRQLMAGQKIEKKEKGPHYSLQLWSKLCKSVVDETLDKIVFSVDILDSTKTYGYKGKMQDGEWIEHPEEALEMLAKDGVIKLKIETEEEFNSNQMAKQFGMLQASEIEDENNNITFLNDIAKQSPTRENLVRNLKANLGVLTNIIFNLHPWIQELNGNSSMNVSTGLTHFVY